MVYFFCTHIYLFSERNMTEYYLGKSDDMDVCRYKGYGSDTSTKQHSGDYTHWQVLAVRLIFVFVFEVGIHI